MSWHRLGQFYDLVIDGKMIAIIDVFLLLDKYVNSESLESEKQITCQYDGLHKYEPPASAVETEAERCGVELKKKKLSVCVLFCFKNFSAYQYFRIFVDSVSMHFLILWALTTSKGLTISSRARNILMLGVNERTQKNIPELNGWTSRLYHGIQVISHPNLKPDASYLTASPQKPHNFPGNFSDAIQASITYFYL